MLVWQEEMHVLRARAGNQPAAVSLPTKKAGGKKNNPSRGKEADNKDIDVETKAKVGFSSCYWCSRHQDVHYAATTHQQTH